MKDSIPPPPEPPPPPACRPTHMITPEGTGGLFSEFYRWLDDHAVFGEIRCFTAPDPLPGEPMDIGFCSKLKQESIDLQCGSVYPTNYKMAIDAEKLSMLLSLIERNYPDFKMSGMCSAHQYDGHYSCKICYPSYRDLCAEHVEVNSELVKSGRRKSSSDCETPREVINNSEFDHIKSGRWLCPSDYHGGVRLTLYINGKKTERTCDYNSYTWRLALAQCLLEENYGDNKLDDWEIITGDGVKIGHYFPISKSGEYHFTLKPGTGA